MSLKNINKNTIPTVSVAIKSTLVEYITDAFVTLA